MNERDIGAEILTGLEEIAAWKKAELELKTTELIIFDLPHPIPSPIPSLIRRGTWGGLLATYIMRKIQC